MDAPALLTARWGSAFATGVDLYHRGAFFEAHEAWEGLWRAERTPPAKLILQGLIQVAVGYHQHFTLQRVDAAVRLLQRGLAKLDAVDPPVLDALAPFRTGVRTSIAALRGGGEASLRVEDLPKLPVGW